MTLIHICDVQHITDFLAKWILDKFTLYIVKYHSFSFIKCILHYITKSKVETGNIHIAYCHKTFIHIYKVHNLINLEIEVDIAQIHIVYCHIPFIPIYQVYITIHSSKWSGNCISSHCLLSQYNSNNLLIC